MPSKLFSIPFTRRHVLLSAEGEQHLDNSLSLNWSARGSLSFRVTRDGQPKLTKEKIHTMLPARHGTAGKTSSVKVFSVSVVLRFLLADSHAVGNELMRSEFLSGLFIPRDRYELVARIASKLFFLSILQKALPGASR